MQWPQKLYFIMDKTQKTNTLEFIKHYNVLLLYIPENLMQKGDPTELGKYCITFIKLCDLPL